MNAIFRGGVGDDVFYVAGQLVIENANEGDDIVYTTARYTLSDNIERLTYIGGGDFTGTGNATANTITGGAGADILIGGGGADVLDGAGGVNAAGYRGSSVIANLSNSALNAGADAVGDIYINIRNLSGTAYTDTLTGDAQNNVLSGNGGNDLMVGGTGADTLDGGDGIDTVSYADAAAGVKVDLSNTANNAGDAVGDVYIAVEVFRGSAYNDTMISASGLTTTMQGGAGDDAFYVDAAADVASENPDEGTDTVYTTSLSYTLAANVEILTFVGAGAFTGTGNATDNTIIGGAGADTLSGGGGADVLDGAGGVNTASYIGSSVVANLADSSLNAGADAVGDIYVNIRNLSGTAYTDTLTGDAQNNVLSGNGGNDLMVGGAGADTLDGGANIDTVSYADSYWGVKVDLSNVANNTGDAAGDVYIAIEAFRGSADNDTLMSSSSVNTTMLGGAGDDAYYVDSTADVTTESASEGEDTVYASSSSYTLAVNVEALTYTGSGTFTGTGNAAANTLTGGANNDTLIGGAGADVLDGAGGVNTASYTGAAVLANLYDSTLNAGADAVGDIYVNIRNLSGTGGHDTLIGDDQNNVLTGGANNDLLIGGDGADTLDGGANIDTVSYADALPGVVVDLTNNANNAGAAVGDVYIGIEMFRGTAWDDVLKSSSAVTTTMLGGAGDDQYYVDSVSDGATENASEGTDTVYASSSSYTLAANLEALTFTGAGTFTGTGNASANTIIGGAGADTLIGGAGADVLDGAGGVNTASYTGSAVLANLANSALNAGADAVGDLYFDIHNLSGTGGADTLVGDDLNNLLSGGSNNDLLAGGAGADTLDGGANIDTASYADSYWGVTVDLSNTANNTGDAAGDVYIGIEVFRGSAESDILKSSAALATTMQGGAGDDFYYVDAVNDGVTENASEGTDTVYATAAYTLSANVEVLTFTGVGAFTGTGNASANTLTGGANNDTLIGGAGADVLDGAGGVNTAAYTGSSVIANLYDSSFNAGADAVGDIYVNIQNLSGTAYTDTLTGDAQNNGLSGNGGNDLMIGGDGADTLDGGANIDTVSYADSYWGVKVDLSNTANNTGDAAGDVYIAVEVFLGTADNDTLMSSSVVTTTMQGGAGDDLYYVDAANDMATENASEGTDTVYAASATYTLGANVEVLTYTATAAFTGTGNALDNTLTGGANNDTLIGGGGADVLDGAGGMNTASYIGSSVVANLADSSLNAGADAVGDIYVNIRNLSGTAYTDTLTGDAQNNVLSGNGGNDLMVGGAGADTLDGGAAVDTVSYADSTAGVKVDVANNANNAGDAAGDVFIAVEVFKGSVYNDTMTSASAVNTTMQGGAADDVYYVDSANDGVTESADEGTDTVYASSATYTLAANVEALTLTAGSATGAGNALDNTITGGAGHDTLIGGGGADVLNGAAGDDAASYSNAASGVVASLVNAGDNTGDAAGDSYVSIRDLIGSGAADRLIGDSQHNQLVGGNGNDTFSGGLGCDVMYGDSGSDIYVYNSIAESTPDALADILQTWSSASDKIDLSAIDADNTVGGDQAFHLDGTWGSAGDISFYYHGGWDLTVVNMNVDNDATTDMTIYLRGNVTVTAGNFIL